MFGDLQVLDPDHVEPPRDAGAGLLGPVFAPVGLPGTQPGDRVLTRPRRFEPRLARASVRCSRRSLVRSRAVRAGQRSNCPWTGPRRRPRPGRCPPPGRYRAWAPARGSRRRRHASARRGPWSPGRTSTPGGTARDQRNRTHPALGTQTWPVFRLTRRTSHCRPRRPTIRNPSSRPALRHDGRPAGLPGSKNAALAWAKSRSACCCTVWEPAASHGCSARAWVSCRHCSR